MCENPIRTFVTRLGFVQLLILAAALGFILLTGTTTNAQTVNPVDDSGFFVTQQYHDFLAREPDPAGLAYWQGQIDQCGMDSTCISNRRIDVSAAFFMENEFQDTGSFVYRMYQASYGIAPTYSQFMADRSMVIGGPNMEMSKDAFANALCQRSEFKQMYPDMMMPADFVTKMMGFVGYLPNSQQCQMEIQGMMMGRTRAQVLRDVVELQDFKQREYNPTFVMMQYFAYLRHDPDLAGYDFWLNVMTNRVPNNYRAMVCAFITSAEYQLRFGPMITHHNSECGP